MSVVNRKQVYSRVFHVRLSCFSSETVRDPSHRLPPSYKIADVGPKRISSLKEAIWCTARYCFNYFRMLMLDIITFLALRALWWREQCKQKFHYHFAVTIKFNIQKVLSIHRACTMCIRILTNTCTRCSKFLLSLRWNTQLHACSWKCISLTWLQLYISQPANTFASSIQTSMAYGLQTHINVCIVFKWPFEKLTARHHVKNSSNCVVRYYHGTKTEIWKYDHCAMCIVLDLLFISYYITLIALALINVTNYEHRKSSRIIIRIRVCSILAYRLICYSPFPADWPFPY